MLKYFLASLLIWISLPSLVLGQDAFTVPKSETNLATPAPVFDANIPKKRSSAFLQMDEPATKQTVAPAGPSTGAFQAPNLPLTATPAITTQGAWTDLKAEPAEPPAGTQPKTSLPNLQKTTSSMPFPGTFIAPTNLQLQREGKTELPPTTLSPLSVDEE